MGRRVLLGIVLISAIVAPDARLGAAASKPQTARAGLSFASGWVNGEPTLSAEGRGVKFFKRVGRDRVLIRVEVTGDRIEVIADTKGAVRIDRNGTILSLQMNGQFETAVTKMQQLMARSAALDGLEAVAAALEGQSHQDARSVMTSNALLHALRGSAGPSRHLARAATSSSTSGVVRAMAIREAGPTACWAEYETTLNHYLVEFNSCTDSYWWIPGWNAACAFQFSLQGELAFFWLIRCSGGMPV